MSTEDFLWEVICLTNDEVLCRCKDEMMADTIAQLLDAHCEEGFTYLVGKRKVKEI